MNPDTATQPSPYAEFLSQLHEQPLEDGPTIRLEVEPAELDRVANWIRGQFDLIAEHSTWRLDRSGHLLDAVDPVEGGTCRMLAARYQDYVDGFFSVLTVLLVPIPHSAH